MATQLSVVNTMLRRLREKQVQATTDNEYSTLLAQIVADSYDEVAGEWTWEPAAYRYVFTIPAGAEFLDLTTATIDPSGAVGQPNPNGDSLLVRDHGLSSCFVAVDGPDKAAYPLTELTATRFADLLATSSNPTDYNNPTTFTLRKRNDNHILLYTWPTVQTDQVIIIHFTTKPLEMKSDGSTDLVEFDIPYRPVQELAMMYALNERGEEMGEPGNLAQDRYIKFLSQAKEAAIKAGEHSDQYDWGRD